MALLLSDFENKYLNQANDQVNKLYDQQKQSQLAELKAQRDSAIGKINQQKTVTKQDYYDKKNAADVTNAQNVQRLRELMASNGISASGDNLTLNARANSDRMNSLGALNQQEQAKMNEYEGQISDWNNPERDNSIINAVEMERTKALMQAQNEARQRAWQEYQFEVDRAEAAARAARSSRSSGGSSSSSTGPDLNALYQEYLAQQGQPTNFLMTPNEAMKRTTNVYAGTNIEKKYTNKNTKKSTKKKKEEKSWWEKAFFGA